MQQTTAPLAARPADGKTPPAAVTPGAAPVQTAQNQTPGTATPATTPAATPAAPLTPPPAAEAKVLVAPTAGDLGRRLSRAPDALPEPPSIGGSAPSSMGSAPVTSSRALPGAPATPPPPSANQNIRVGGNVQEARVLSKVQPAYPPLARQARVSGTVRVEATIGKDGRVKRAVAISGPPLLRQAAAEAVQRWKYSPGTLNGEPQEVTTQVDVAFALGNGR